MEGFLATSRTPSSRPEGCWRFRRSAEPAIEDFQARRRTATSTTEARNAGLRRAAPEAGTFPFRAAPANFHLFTVPGDFASAGGSQIVASKADFQRRQLAWKSSLTKLARAQLRPQAAKEDPAKLQNPGQTAGQLAAVHQLRMPPSDLLTGVLEPALPASAAHLETSQLERKTSPTDFRPRQLAAHPAAASNSAKETSRCWSTAKPA